jgi:protein TonB
VPAKREQGGEGRVILMEPAPTLAGGPAVPAGAMLPDRVNIISALQAAAPPAPPERIQVGGQLQSAMLVRKVDPVYPALARQMRIQGIVRFAAVIGKDGNVQDIRFVSGPQLLAQAGADAVKRWVYRPTLLNGHPVEVSTQIAISFSLGN